MESKFSTEQDSEIGSQKYLKKDRTEKPGIKLEGASLVFFKAVQKVLDARKEEFLIRLMPPFLNACQAILTYCPGMSAFDGPWKSEKNYVLTVKDAQTLVGEPFFNAMLSLFDIEL